MFYFPIAPPYLIRATRRFINSCRFGMDKTARGRAEQKKAKVASRKAFARYQRERKTHLRFPPEAYFLSWSSLKDSNIGSTKADIRIPTSNRGGDNTHKWIFPTRL